MALRYLSFFALVLAMATFMGCGSGGSGTGRAAAIRACGEAGSFCLVDCNLGCNFKGCSLTDIAQNQPLVFTFSRDIDPSTVGFGSISLKTASGSEPVGNFFVEGPTVTFVPDVLNLGGAAFFGFTSGETYFLEIAGGNTAATPLRSVSGDLLGESIRCSVRISLGVVDLDGKPPRVKVLSPAFTDNVPLSTIIVLEFDELIDHGSFAGLSGADAPIVFQMRSAEPIDPLDPNSPLVCVPSSEPRLLPGEPQLLDDKNRGVTTVSFVPLQPLKGNGCLEVSITAAVRDLAGTPAQPQIFSFTTEVSNLPPQNVDEDFSDDLMLDLVRSSGSWGGGSGIFGKAGGDGNLGDFDITDGRALNEDETIWEWRSDGMTITSDEVLSNNFHNQTRTINDGVFQFTDFVLPEEMTLRFVGRNPVRIFVRGRCDIFGRIELNGLDNSGLWAGKAKDAQGNPMPLPQLGQLGSPGGAGGGGGGRGAPTAGVGAPGTDVKPLPGNVFEIRKLLTGGRGGPLVPSHGDPALIDFTTPPPDLFMTPVFTFSQYAAGGGSGGGFLQPGVDGRVLQHAFVTELFGPVIIPPLDPLFISPDGPNVNGGILFDFLPKPSAESSDHYVIGGSGGGGGGSHAMLAERSPPPALTIEPVLFSTGAGGAGGGGAVAIRVGRRLTTGPLSVIECIGGSAADQSRAPAVFGAKFPDGIAAPGGGGSGGSILLMVDGEGELQGSLDVSGGTGGVARLEIPPAGQNSKFAYDTRGGDGSPGYIRFAQSQPNPSINLLGAHAPAGSGVVVEIEEDWPIVAFQSLWYETQQVFAPLYQRYEIEAEVDGVTTIYSDDPSLGILAQHGTSPLAFYIQGGDIVPGSGQVLDPSAVRGWRQHVGPFNPVPGGPSLNGDNKNGFRWILILDRDFGADVVIKRVRIVFKP